jgi:outer membrane immunogenic protein
MKRIIVLTVALGAAALASAAMAADMAPRYTKAPPPPPAPILTWTGFYVGINGGWAGTNHESMTYNDLANRGLQTDNAYNPLAVNASASGGLGGFHAGYNWQAAPNWVFGIEGDWDWTHLNAGATNRLTRAVDLTLFTDSAFLHTDVRSLASIRGRVGYAWNNQWLFYATGGVGFADMKFNAAVDCSNGPVSFCRGGAQAIRSQFSDTRTGAVFGAGIEFKPAAHWTFGAEYLHYDFHDTNTTGGSWFVVATGAPAPFFECGTPGQNCAKFSFGNLGINTGRLRLSYQFQP